MNGISLGPYTLAFVLVMLLGLPQCSSAQQQSLIIPPGITGICSEGAVTHVSYSVSISPPIQGVYLVNETVYKSIVNDRTL